MSPESPWCGLVGDWLADVGGFVKAVKKAATELVNGRFLLQEDADAFISAAETSAVLR
jgi:hypothetical protein